jgi:hypothetical protein
LPAAPQITEAEALAKAETSNIKHQRNSAFSSFDLFAASSVCLNFSFPP